MRKKTLLMAAMTGAGLMTARWRTLPPGVYCFTFHRIGDPASTTFSRNVFSCTKRRLEEVVGFLNGRFEFINLERLRELVRSGGECRSRFALLTFDDGYLDNYTDAFPVLKRLGVPGTFFLPTAFIGSDRLPWWEEIPWVLRRSMGKTIRLRGAESAFALSPSDEEPSIRRVMNFVKSRPIPPAEQIAEIREACGERSRPQSANRLFMNWDEAREMQSGGMDIGSHTHTHRLLGQLSEREQTEELGTSKEILESRLRTPIHSISYPIGSRGAYSDTTCRIAASLGYELGFNFRRHNNPTPARNPLDIGRLAVDEPCGRWQLQSSICFPKLFAV